MSTALKRILLFLIAGALFLLASWSSYQVFNYATQTAKIKSDYSEVNSITYGILSVNNWRDHLTSMVLNRIDDFEFTETQEDTLVIQVSRILNSAVNKADRLMDKKQKGIKAKLTKFAVRTFVDEEKIRAMVPVFAQTMVNEIKKPENKNALKQVIKSKIEEYSAMTHADSEAALKVDSLYTIYGVKDLAEFNKNTADRLVELKTKTYHYTYILLGIILVFLILWWFLRNQKVLHTPLFIISVLVSFVVLFAGVTAPMIEIDARFQQVNFVLIGEKIAFNDQVIFFQSKSILDVIEILLRTGKVDSILVGILILVFSIIFPVTKLISTQIYLAGNKNTRKNKILNFFTFKSGKWSMADVYVIAIFMAYIGFQGILDHQLSRLNMETESLVSISTNNTSLQPGYIIFIGFVLYSLLLSLILKRITGKEKKDLKIQAN
jgi:hypothetical protein